MRASPAWAASAVRTSPGTGRLERYADPDGAIVTTGTPNAFRVTSGSLGVDVATVPGVVWRMELRGLSARDPIFPKHASSGLAKQDGFVVSSLALTF
jgi:hypothetical protein